MSNITKSNINATPAKGVVAPSVAAKTKILSEANEAFKDMYDKIEETLLAEQQNVIRARYQIGELVYDMSVDEQKYGSRCIERMEEVVGYDRTVIYNSLSFVKKYSKEEMEELISLTTVAGRPLLWTHVTHLLRVTDNNVREDLIDMIIDKDLSPTELLDTIQQMQNKPIGRTSNAGKPMARPKSIKGFIEQQWTLIEQLLRRKDKVWAGTEKQGDRSFFDTIADTPTDKIGPETVEQLDKLQKLYEKASFELDEYATKLLAIRKKLEKTEKDEVIDYDDTTDSSEDNDTEPDDDQLDDLASDDSSDTVAPVPVNKTINQRPAMKIAPRFSRKQPVL